MKYDPSLYSIYTHPPSLSEPSFRSSRDRVSSYIEWKEANGFLSALERFQLDGTAVNTLVTVNLEWLGIKPRDCSLYARQSLQRLKRQMTRLDCPWAMAWVLENSDRVGVHLHFLIHRSPDLMIDYPHFGKILRKAFRVEKSSTRSKTIQFSKFNSWRASYEHNRGQLERYLLKGIRPEIAEELEITSRIQGYIVGKRIGHK